MHPETPLPPPPARGTASKPPRGVPWILWLVIAGLAVGWIVLGREEEPDAADPEAPSVVSVQTELVGEITYAFVPMRGEELSAEMLLMNARPLADSKKWLDRVAWAILVGAIDSPQAGEKALERAAVPEDSKTPELDAALLAGVRGRLPALAPDAVGGATPQVGDDGADLSRLGWYGKLLRNEVDPRPSVVFGLLAFGVWFVGCFLVGLAVAVTLVVFAAMGRMRFSLASPVPAARVYGETFAIWMALFLGLNVLGGAIASLALGEEPAPDTEKAAGLAAGIVGFLLSLAALA